MSTAAAQPQTSPSAQQKQDTVSSMAFGLGAIRTSNVNVTNIAKDYPNWSDKDKDDIIKLRDFINEKDAQLKDNNETLAVVSANLSRLNLFSSFADKPAALKDSISSILHYLNQTKLANKIISALPDIDRISSNPGIQILKKLKYNNFPVGEGLASLSEAIDQYNNQQAFAEKLKSNIENIKSDLLAAEEKVQNIYSVTINLNWTKLAISGTFGLMILTLLALFFIFLFKVTDPSIASTFLTGNGIQFVALFALIIAIVLFGILGILEGRELAAILSGISGFILGKGITANTNVPNNGQQQQPQGQQQQSQGQQQPQGQQQQQGSQQGQQVKVALSLDTSVPSPVANAATGAALNNASVQIIQSGPNTITNGNHLSTDPDGTFTFTGVMAGGYTLSGSLQVTPAGATAPVTLTGTQTISIQPGIATITLTIK